MEKFLSSISKEVIEISNGDFRNISVVFPSRRAGLYFKRELVKQVNKTPFISPAIYSINDFIFKYSGLRSENPLRLIFRLYDVQQSLRKNENPDKFFDWGRIMLGDFDEIDRSLVDADKLFEIVTDIKTLEERMKPDLEKDYIEFWNTFNRSKEDMKKNFQETWKLLPEIYKKFTTDLLNDKLAYDGLAYRKLSEMMDAGRIDFSGNRIIFAGFNFLSLSELNIIYKSVLQTDGKIYFDADNFYLKDALKEAGKYINKNVDTLKKLFSADKKNPDDFIKIITGDGIDREGKNINIIGVPLSIGMSKAFGNELSKLDFENENEIAALLPDESMLMPVMMSVPEKINKFNITMGLPFRDTPLFSLIYLIRDLQSDIKEGKFYYKDILKILLHPYVRFENMSSVHKIINRINSGNHVYLSKEELLGNDKTLSISEKIFTIIDKTENIFTYLKEIVSTMYDRIYKYGQKSGFQIEYLFGFYTQVKVLQDCMEKFNIQTSTDVCWNILAEIIRTQNIPLTGEPVTGMQIMGLLESRAIDFKDVFILSANESVFPRINISGSFIPYQIRKYFRMKTYDDDSNIQAYNFFRVIQRADNVYIFYNLLVSDDARGKSRFILQLENEISKSTIIQKTYSICIPKLTDDDISIEKNENMLEKIKSVSPTDISTYLTCSLKFYFQKILGIWEEDKVEEEYNAGTMGSLLHKVMELIYKPYENKTVNEETIEKIINSINNDFDKIFSNAVEGIINEQKEHKRPEKSIDTGKYGKNKAYKEMIREQALKILEWDKTKKLFDIKGLEKNMQKNDYEFTDKKNVDRKIILKGKLDRIEQKDNSIFIVDYKTGSLKFPSNGKIESLEIAMSNNKFKDYFQAGFYIYLYERINKEKADAGMYYVANQSALQKVSDVKIKDNSPSKNEVADKQNTKEGKEQKDFLSEFGNFLDNKLADIFDTSIRFSKTSEPKDCAYCPMTSLCYRESTNSW